MIDAKMYTQAFNSLRKERDDAERQLAAYSKAIDDWEVACNSLRNQLAQANSRVVALEAEKLEWRLSRLETKIIPKENMPKDTKFEREDIVRFHDPDGFVYEIREDSDGLGLIELSYHESPSSPPLKDARLSMQPEHALAIGKALVEAAEKRLREQKG